MQGLSAVVNGIRVSRPQASLHSRHLMSPQFYFVVDIAYIQEFDKGVIVWLAGSFACDLIIAVTMIIIVSFFLWWLHQTSMTLQIPQLFRAIRATSFSEKTGSLYTSLIVLVVETGAATVFSACLQLIFFLTMSKNFLHLMV
jgi:hypothetical protein